MKDDTSNSFLIKVKKLQDGKLIIIEIPAEFRFNQHRDFRNTYKDTRNDAKFVIDMKQTKYLDSSALGMLLILREHVDKVRDRVSIVNCNDMVYKLLQVVRFERYFDINKGDYFESDNNSDTADCG